MKLLRLSFRVVFSFLFITIGLVIAGCVAPANSKGTGNLQSQTISFGAIATQTVGTPLTLTATATSGLAVSFTSETTGVCTVSGTSIILAASGTCTIEATQSGNAAYAAATTVTQSFTVNGEAQTISFANPGTQTAGAQLALTATTTSGLAVTFASTTHAICTVSGTEATLIASGSCSITASQAGNSTYAAATPVLQSFTVNGEAQTISFANPGTQTGGTSLALTATASSGLPVSFTSTTLSVCTMTGSQAVFSAVTTASTCTIVANQPGNAVYASAPPVSQSFTVSVASGDTPGNLSYAVNPAVYTIGSLIAPNILTDSSGTGVSYSISPNLPAGLMIDTTTGDITGTPTAMAATATYLVTATNAYGSSTVDLTLTVNFVAATPAQYGYPVPSPEPALPTGFDTFTPPLYTISSSAPAVAEWTRSAGQGNAMELSMAALTGDTSFVVYGQTGVAETAPLTMTPPVLDYTPQGTASAQLATLLLPTEAGGLSQGMYLAWPENSIGYGGPVAINRTEAWWAGPLTATVGDTVSVFGQNLTYPGTYPDTLTPHGAYPLVYLVSTDGGSEYTPTVTGANPYKVDFSTAGLAPDTYNIWIHNGAGEHFGWSEAYNMTSTTPAQNLPAVLTLGATSPWDCESSGPSSFNVTSAAYGAAGDGSTDDTLAITNAITAAGNYANNASHPYATVYFPAGTYMVSTGFQPPNNVCFMGVGTTNWQNQTVSSPTASILRLSQTNTTCVYPPPAYVQSNGAFIWANEGVTGGGSNNVEFTEMVLDANGNIPCLYMSGSGVDQIATQSTQVRFRGEHNAKFDHIVLNGTGAGLSWEGGGGFGSFDFSGGVNYYLTDSTIIGNGVENIGTNQVFVSGNTFLEADNNGGVMGDTAPTQTAFWNNTMEDLAKYNTDDAAAGNPLAQIPYNGGSASLQAAFASSYNPLSGGYPLYITNIGPYGEGRIAGSETYETGLIYIGQNTNLNAGPCDPTNTTGAYPTSYPGCYQGPDPPDTATNQNAGEQVLFETASTDYAGLATAPFNSTTANVSGLTETSCGFSGGADCVGEDAVIVGGTGLGQNRHIVAQSGSTITLSEPWRVMPDATSKINITNDTYQVAVYGNYEQGKTDQAYRYTSLAGVEPAASVFGIVYDSNQVFNVRTGINVITEQTSRTGEDWIIPNYFDLFMNNTFKGAFTGINIADSTSGPAGVPSGDQQAVSFVGDIFRNNVFGTADSTTPVNTGIFHTGIEIAPCEGCSDYLGGDTVQGIVLDGDTFVVNPSDYPALYWVDSSGYLSEIPSGLWTDAGPALVVDTLMNNTSFTLLPSSTSGYTGASYGLEFGQGSSTDPTQPATPGDTCFETGSNIVSDFQISSFGLTCKQE